MSNSLDPGPDSVNHYLDPICLQRLSADDKKWQLARKELSEETKPMSLHSISSGSAPLIAKTKSILKKILQYFWGVIITCDPSTYTLYIV